MRAIADGGTALLGGSLRLLGIGALRYLPLPWAINVIRSAADAGYRLSPRVRNNAVARMRCFYPEASSDAVTAHAREFHRHRLAAKPLNYLIMDREVEQYRSLLTVEGWQRVDTALARGRGVVLLASHVGLPRLLRWYLRSRREYPVQYLVRFGFPRERETIGQWFEARLRHRFQVDNDHLTGDTGLSLSSLKKAHDHLRGNGLVFITGDGRFGDRKLPVRIVGRETEIPLGGISLGLSSGATILPVFSNFDMRPRFRIEIQRPLSFPSTAPRIEQLDILGKTYASRLEAYILSNPTGVFGPGQVPLPGAPLPFEPCP